MILCADCQYCNIHLYSLYSNSSFLNIWRLVQASQSASVQSDVELRQILQSTFINKSICSVTVCSGVVTIIVHLQQHSKLHPSQISDAVFYMKNIFAKLNKTNMTVCIDGMLTDRYRLLFTCVTTFNTMKLVI